jgi:hypothetical protein
MLILLLLNNPANAEEPVLTDVRALFLLSGSSESSCKDLQHLLKDVNEAGNPVLGAYKACANMMMAGYVFNPVSKLSYFNEGKELLDKCIKADSLNIELHYLRIAMQSEAPSFLGYKQFIAADKNFILAKIDSVNDPHLHKMIASFLIKSTILTEKEKKQLNHE